MVKYSTQPSNPEKSARALGVDLRVHFKNTYEVGRAIKGLELGAAIKYMEAVLEKKRCIPFRRFNDGVGRTAQVHEMKINGSPHTQGRWPVKSCQHVLKVLKNAESNAEFKSLETGKLIISHVAVQKAIPGRRRTYRAHGRINAYMSHPCHIEILLEEKKDSVSAPKTDSRVVRLTRKQLARKTFRAHNGDGKAKVKKLNDKRQK